MQNAAPEHQKRVRRTGFLHPHGEVLFKLAFEAFGGRGIAPAVALLGAAVHQLAQPAHLREALGHIEFGKLRGCCLEWKRELAGEHSGSGDRLGVASETSQHGGSRPQSGAA